MAIRQLRVQVKSFGGRCDTECTDCTTVRGVVDRDVTVNGSGILLGSIVPRAIDNATLWTEGCHCYANFEFDDDQLIPDTILRTCDICLACGCVVDYVDRVVENATGCDAVRACITGINGLSANVNFNNLTGEIGADVNLSSLPGNNIQLLADGLAVRFPQVDGCSLGYFTGV
jgi:hypothetical protein